MKHLFLTADELRTIADGMDNQDIDIELEHHKIKVQELIMQVHEKKIFINLLNPDGRSCLCLIHRKA